MTEIENLSIEWKNEICKNREFSQDGVHMGNEMWENK